MAWAQERETPGRPGRAAIFEQFAADGITHMFGNPGTVEQGFLDAGADFDLEYVLTLQETVAVGIADGYARAGQRPGLVQLHSGVGLGNGIGMLYQARRGGTPLVVVVGDAGVRYDAMDGQMAADLVAMAEPVAKYVTRVTHPTSVLRVLRRAVKMAMTPPRGPVVVVLPADVLDAETTEPVVPTSIPSTATAPAPAAVEAAARALLAGERPLVLMGDGVAAAGAQAELTSVAERLDAPVWGVTSSEVNFDTGHRLYGGELGHMFGETSERIVRDADTVLIVGTYAFPEVYPALRNPFAPGASIVHIDLDSYEIAKNFPVDHGIVADPRLALAALAEEFDRQRPAGRTGLHQFPVGAEPAGERDQALVSDEDSVLTSFVRGLAERTGEDLIVFDEALTAAGPIMRYLLPRAPGRFFQTRGGSLGVGIPGAIGAKLARPDAPVVGFSGDGASMYTIQALWTAARYDIDVKFVVCNNRRYQLLDDNIEQYWQSLDLPARDHPRAFDLSTPDIAFPDLAGALGIPARRVDKTHEVDGALETMLRHRGPFLVDLNTG
jgi:benzoylformate decarboxylase